MPPSDVVGLYSQLFGWSRSLQTKRFSADKRPFTRGYQVEHKQESKQPVTSPNAFLRTQIQDIQKQRIVNQ